MQSVSIFDFNSYKCNIKTYFNIMTQINNYCKREMYNSNNFDIFDHLYRYNLILSSIFKQLFESCLRKTFTSPSLASIHREIAFL